MELLGDACGSKSQLGWSGPLRTVSALSALTFDPFQPSSSKFSTVVVKGGCYSARKALQRPLISLAPSCKQNPKCQDPGLQSRIPHGSSLPSFIGRSKHSSIRSLRNDPNPELVFIDNMRILQANRKRATETQKKEPGHTHYTIPYWLPVQNSKILR